MKVFLELVKFLINKLQQILYALNKTISTCSSVATVFKILSKLSPLWQCIISTIRRLVLKKNYVDKT